MCLGYVSSVLKNLHSAHWYCTVVGITSSPKPSTWHFNFQMNSSLFYYSTSCIICVMVVLRWCPYLDPFPIATRSRQLVTLHVPNWYTADLFDGYSAITYSHSSWHTSCIWVRRLCWMWHSAIQQFTLLPWSSLCLAVRERWFTDCIINFLRGCLIVDERLRTHIEVRRRLWELLPPRFKHLNDILPALSHHLELRTLLIFVNKILETRPHPRTRRSCPNKIIMVCEIHRR